MQRLVKLISSILLMFIVMLWMNQQGEAEPQEAMSQVRHISSVIRSEQSSTERTMVHLYAEQLAIPVPVAGEVPGYHPSHSKPKCLHTAQRANRYGLSASTEAIGSPHHRTPTPNHVIDYYIYTLEHILI